MSQKTYTVNKHRQLVDLNGDSINFDLTFTCTSKDNAPFDVLVVDQATLDATPTLQYKKANGTISGNIVADKNIYQNYFLVLKAGKPCEVTVKTIKKDIPPSVPKPPVPRMATPRPPLKPPVRPGKKSWKNITLAIIIVGGGALLIFLYLQNKKKASAATTAASPATTVVPLSTVSSGPPPPPPPSPSPSPSLGGLLDRLKKLPLN
jgi:hypothetical protein